MMIVIATGLIILSSLSICFDYGYEVKQPVALKEYCTEKWLKEHQESIDRCTCSHDITIITLKMVLNHYQTTNIRPIQIEANCRRHFKVHLKWKIKTVQSRIIR